MTLRLACWDGGCRSTGIHSWKVVGCVGEQGATAVSFTPHNLSPPARGWMREGRNGNGGEDEEDGRVACAARRIVELRLLLGEAGAGEEAVRILA